MPIVVKNNYYNKDSALHYYKIQLEIIITMFSSYKNHTC